MLADCAQNYKIMPPQPMYLPILLLNIVLVLGRPRAVDGARRHG